MIFDDLVSCSISCRSDFIAISLQLHPTDTRNKIVMVGQWVFNGKTIRNYDYSTDMSVNPTTYDYLNHDGWDEVHNIGEVWCNMLWEMEWNIIDATKKINTDWFSKDYTAGNILAVQYVVDALKLSPCSPSFVQMRDSILQAEKALTQGKHACAIWKAFAKRGLGKSAVDNPVTAAFDLPAGC